MGHLARFCTDWNSCVQRGFPAKVQIFREQKIWCGWITSAVAGVVNTKALMLRDQVYTDVCRIGYIITLIYIIKVIRWFTLSISIWYTYIQYAFTFFQQCSLQWKKYLFDLSTFSCLLIRGRRKKHPQMFYAPWVIDSNQSCKVPSWVAG